MSDILVFTDLDGTFLDHHSYAFTPLLPAARRLKALGVPVIPTTSKTLAEIRALDYDFGADVPAIAENGMVVSMPGEAPLALGASYDDVQAFLDGLPEGIRAQINGFGQMSLDTVMQHTGLPAEGAVLAKDRAGSEPFLWAGDDAQLRALYEAVAKAGLQITRGGRFYHLMSPGGKDKAMLYVRDQINPQAKMIALGDGPNDAAMLAVADIGVKIPNASGADFSVDDARGRVMEAPATGPAGWNAAMYQILDGLGLDE